MTEADAGGPPEPKTVPTSPAGAALPTPPLTRAPLRAGHRAQPTPNPAWPVGATTAQAVTARHVPAALHFRAAATEPSPARWWGRQRRARRQRDGGDHAPTASGAPRPAPGGRQRRRCPAPAITASVARTARIKPSAEAAEAALVRKPRIGDTRPAPAAEADAAAKRLPPDPGTARRRRGCQHVHRGQAPPSPWRSWPRGRLRLRWEQAAGTASGASQGGGQGGGNRNGGGGGGRKGGGRPACEPVTAITDDTPIDLDERP